MSELTDTFEPTDAFEIRVDNAFERIRRLCEERTANFNQHLSQQPATRECRNHAGQTATLNEEASLLDGKAVYRCPNCVRDMGQRKRAKRLESAGIPADVRGATLDNFQINRSGVKSGETHKQHLTPAAFLDKARAFAERKTRNLMLCGSPGIGKGHLAAAIAIARLDDGWPVAWVDCAALFRAFHSAYKDGSNDAVIDRHAGTSLLILDEICLRDLPADGEEILFTILDRRHKSGLQTILLGNAPAEQVRKWLGGRIVDRLRSGGISFCFGEWDSMRGTAQDGSQISHEL